MSESEPSWISAREATPVELEAIATERNEQYRKARIESWNRLEVPRRYWPHLLGDEPTQPTDALAAVQAFLAQLRQTRAHARPVFLVLRGEKGVGKTHAAACFAADRGARFVHAIELARHGLYGEDAAWWRALERSPALVLDDLGREPLDGGGYLLASLYALINHRYANALPLVITSNLTTQAFRSRYLTTGEGDLLLDRLTQCSRGVRLEGASMRKAITEGH